jgi:hypothetical protein
MTVNRVQRCLTMKDDVRTTYQQRSIWTLCQGYLLLFFGFFRVLVAPLQIEQLFGLAAGFRVRPQMRANWPGGIVCSFSFSKGVFP